MFGPTTSTFNFIEFILIPVVLGYFCKIKFFISPIKIVLLNVGLVLYSELIIFFISFFAVVDNELEIPISKFPVIIWDLIYSGRTVIADFFFKKDIQDFTEFESILIVESEKDIKTLPKLGGIFSSPPQMFILFSESIFEGKSFELNSKPK